MPSAPKVFIGSSTERLQLAHALKKRLRQQADVGVWNETIFTGAMLLDDILRLASSYDFGVFIFLPDDQLTTHRRKVRVVRHNVLFEAGVFMGALGRERTFLVGSSKDIGTHADLRGLVTVEYSGKHLDDKHLSPVVLQIGKAIARSGPIVRFAHDEILQLRATLEQQEFRVGTRLYCVLELLRQSAAKREPRWYPSSSAEDLVEGIMQEHNTYVADTAYWWLIVHGVLRFVDIDYFTSSKSWHWRESVEYARISERGAVLLNNLQEGMLGARGHGGAPSATRRARVMG